MAAASGGPEIGFEAPRFTMKNIDGRTLDLADVAGERGTVVAFICNHCPYVKEIADRLACEAAALVEQGINVVAINANDATAYPEDSFDNMKAFAAKHRFQFPYLHDETQEVARAYGAVCTPDFFGFDAGLRLKYRGRLDSARNATAGEANERELYDAMVGIAETGDPPAQQFPAMGCSIKWRIRR